MPLPLDVKEFATMQTVKSICMTKQEIKPSI